MPKKFEDVTVDWKNSKDHITSPVNGVRGGAWKEEVIANFIFEKHSMPTFESVPLNEDGRPDLDAVITTKSAKLAVDVIATLVMSPQTAIEIGNWLIARAADAKSHLKIGMN